MGQDWSLDDYIDAARDRHNLNSDNQLSKRLGYRTTNVSFWRTGRSIPSEMKMEHLAKLAGRDPDVALMELAAWRADGGLKLRYLNIAHKLATVAASMLIILALSAPAALAQAQNIAAESAVILYIMESRLRRKIRCLFVIAYRFFLIDQFQFMPIYDAPNSV